MTEVPDGAFRFEFDVAGVFGGLVDSFWQPTATNNNTMGTQTQFLADIIFSPKKLTKPSKRNRQSIPPILTSSSLANFADKTTGISLLIDRNSSKKALTPFVSPLLKRKIAD
jgi:hypothetical protein